MGRKACYNVVLKCLVMGCGIQFNHVNNFAKVHEWRFKASFINIYHISAVTEKRSLACAVDAHLANRPSCKLQNSRLQNSMVQIIVTLPRGKLEDSKELESKGSLFALYPHTTLRTNSNVISIQYQPGPITLLLQNITSPFNTVVIYLTDERAEAHGSKEPDALFYFRIFSVVVSLMEH
uniref:TMEM132 domain-containing protein n=1 Tax=Steinernema glaseri TaxID=37863 RepID=A0A1I8ADK1_9BILA